MGRFFWRNGVIGQSFWRNGVNGHIFWRNGVIGQFFWRNGVISYPYNPHNTSHSLNENEIFWMFIDFIIDTQWISEAKQRRLGTIQ